MNRLLRFLEGNGGPQVPVLLAFLDVSTICALSRTSKSFAQLRNTFWRRLLVFELNFRKWPTRASLIASNSVASIDGPLFPAVVEVIITGPERPHRSLSVFELSHDFFDFARLKNTAL